MEHVKTTVKIQTEIPSQLLDEARLLVDDGWYRNIDEILFDALRRFLESHRTKLVDEFIQQDVKWGLYGHE
jgi:Arc/MetJ-type ribon-helix-helix transcriptional regulator